MFPVADDFAAIAKRLKEIQAEVANERAGAAAKTQPEDACQGDSQGAYDDMAACA